MVRVVLPVAAQPLMLATNTQSKIFFIFILLYPLKIQAAFSDKPAAS
jgi:hypothetical protein